MRAFIFLALALFTVAACSNSDQPLRDLRASGGGPDEFAVILGNPLETPSSNALPAPTPGGTNRADPTPEAEAIAILGGSTQAQVAGGIPARDEALIAQAGRYGVDPDIRSSLAAEDEALRERAQIANIFNPLGRDRYFQAYRNQALDAPSELVRLQDAGVAVPAMPAQANQEPDRAIARFIRQLGFRDDCVFTTIGSPDGRFRRVCSDDQPEQTQ